MEHQLCASLSNKYFPGSCPQIPPLEPYEVITAISQRTKARLRDAGESSQSHSLGEAVGTDTQHLCVGRGDRARDGGGRRRNESVPMSQSMDAVKANSSLQNSCLTSLMTRCL